MGGDVAAGDHVVAAAREQQQPAAGALERGQVLALPHHVVEGVAGLGAVEDGVLVEHPVDHVLQEERVLEPAVALGGDQRTLVPVATISW